jgi:hypothetical protein
MADTTSPLRSELDFNIDVDLSSGNDIHTEVKIVDPMVPIA